MPRPKELKYKEFFWAHLAGLLDRFLKRKRFPESWPGNTAERFKSALLCARVALNPHLLEEDKQSAVQFLKLFCLAPDFTILLISFVRKELANQSVHDRVRILLRLGFASQHANLFRFNVPAQELEAVAELIGIPPSELIAKYQKLVAASREPRNPATPAVNPKDDVVAFTLSEILRTPEAITSETVRECRRRMKREDASRKKRLTGPA